MGGGERGNKIMISADSFLSRYSLIIDSLWIFIERLIVTNYAGDIAIWTHDANTGHKSS